MIQYLIFVTTTQGVNILWDQTHDYTLASQVAEHLKNAPLPPLGVYIESYAPEGCRTSLNNIGQIF